MLAALVEELEERLRLLLQAMAPVLLPVDVSLAVAAVGVAHQARLLLEAMAGMVVSPEVQVAEVELLYLAVLPQAVTEETAVTDCAILRHTREYAMRTLMFLIILLAAPSAALAERWILIGPDSVVITVIENNGYPTGAVPPDGGYIVQDFAGSQAASGTTYSNGTFLPRPKTNPEIIGEKLDAAIDLNMAYLALTLPTAAQSTVQIKALTRQVNGVLRLMRNRLEASD